MPAARGKADLRAYWSKALALIPNLHFTLIDTYVSPDGVVVFFKNADSNSLRTPILMIADSCR